MAKISKKRKREILETRFPELCKLTEELGQALDCVLSDIEEKLEKVEEVKDKLEELKEAKIELDDEMR